MLGVAAALQQNRGLDHAAISPGRARVCIPTFVSAPLLVLVSPRSWAGCPPPAGPAPARVFAACATLILPVTVLALPVRHHLQADPGGDGRGAALDHVRTQAKGLALSTIVVKHALPAAILPLVDYLGPACAGLITGSLVVEQIFQLPGLGRSFVLGALQRDYTLVMGVRDPTPACVNALPIRL